MQRHEPLEFALECDPEALLAAALEHAELVEAANEDDGAPVVEEDPAPRARRSARRWR